MTASNPLVSILIVTWNRCRELCRCLDSALAQTCRDLEIVVFDNASSDDTARVVRERYPGVRLLRSHRNLGCPSARNLGVANCRGNYVYLLDDDGWLKEDAVGCAVDRAQSDPAIAAVLSGFSVVKDGRVIAVRPENQREPGYRASFIGCCVLLHRQAFLEAGGFPDDFFRQGEEDDLALRWLERGLFCYLEPASVMYHEPSPIRQHQNEIVYYTLRNTTRTGLRFWPFPWCALRPLVNGGYALQAMLGNRDGMLPWRLLADLLCDLAHLRKQRVPVSKHTFRLFRELSRHPSPIRPKAPLALTPRE